MEQYAGAKVIGENAWREFITELEQKIDWHSGSFIKDEAPKVEAILQDIASKPEAFRARTQQIIEDAALLSKFQVHMDYPRQMMDKFILHMDANDRFRVRLHRFKTRRQNGWVTERIHSHKWNMCTLLLRGRYRQNAFEVTDIDESSGKARLNLLNSRVLEAGESNSLAAGIPHQVVNEQEDDYAITLFVRGPSIGSARIYDIEHGAYHETFDPLGQLKVGLESMGRLDPNFH